MINRQSNTYTIIYAAVLVLIVGAALSAVYQALRPAQVENINNDTRRQILAAARITADKGESIADLYAEHVTDSFIVNYRGERVDNGIDPFTVKVSEQVKKPENERLLPVFQCQTVDGTKYIIPVSGAGLWGPIWGYVALDSNGDTIYGAYFGHEGETPGLGAEIEKPAFSDQFRGKNLFADGHFESVAVAKTGREPDAGDYVNAVSGATITSTGVQNMLQNSLRPYSKFLLTLK